MVVMFIRHLEEEVVVVAGNKEENSLTSSE